MRLVNLSSSRISGGTSEGADSKRETAAELRRSVYARIAVHGQTIREVGKAMGLTDRTVTDLLLEAQAHEKQRAIRLAWDNGRRSTLPPLTAMRRAA